MKTFRLFGVATIAILMGVNLISCSEDDDTIEPGEKNEMGLPTNIAKSTIVYKTSDNIILRFENEDIFGGAKIKSNTYSTSKGYGTITFESEVTSIEEDAFNNSWGDNEGKFDNLIGIVLPNSVASIGDYAFYECENLSYVYLPNSVKNIGEEAFYDCNLTSINIPNSIESIGSYAFSSDYYGGNNTHHLTTVYITDLKTWCNIEWDDYSAFDRAHNLILNGKNITDLVIPNSITEIKDNAFYYCSGINKVIIPHSVTIIGESAFKNCTGLKEITIGSSVEEIEYNAFEGCDSIQTVYCKPTTPPCSGNPFEYYDDENREYTSPIIYVPKSAIEIYKEEWWEEEYIKEGDF